MSATILRFPAEPPVDRQLTLNAAARAFIAVEDALAGDWSDSTLIACLVGADRLERMQILAVLEDRGRQRCSL